MEEAYHKTSLLVILQLLMWNLGKKWKQVENLNKVATNVKGEKKHRIVENE